MPLDLKNIGLKQKLNAKSHQLKQSATHRPTESNHKIENIMTMDDEDITPLTSRLRNHESD